MDDYLVDYLREGHILLELHACQGAGKGGVEYATVGSCRLPLEGLLEGTPGGWQYWELPTITR